MFYFYLFIWLHHVFVATCRPFFALHTWDLRFPWPGIRPASPALEGRVLNHWTTREVPTYLLLRNWIPKWRCPIAIKSQETEREKRSGPEMQSWRSVGHKKGHQEVQFIFIHIHIQVFTPLSFFFFFFHSCWNISFRDGKIPPLFSVRFTLTGVNLAWKNLHNPPTRMSKEMVYCMTKQKAELWRWVRHFLFPFYKFSLPFLKVIFWG